jgi:plasmid stability protein
MPGHHDAKMRTTLTLDDDLAEKLKSLAARRKTSFKEVVNEVLRRGITAQERTVLPKRFRVVPFRSAFRAGVDPLKLNQLSDEIEVERAADRIRDEGGR